MRSIALFTPSKNTYSETFIQVHISGLDSVLWVYHDGEQPNKCNEVRLSNLSKWTMRILNFWYGKRWGLEQWRLFLSLRKNKPDLTYMEYGTTAVANADVLEMLRIPMVVNFHGYDISVFDILKKNQEGYKRLFAQGINRFVVVSKKMEERIIQMGARPNAVLYSPCGANGEYQNVIPNRQSKQFVMLGRLVEKKSPLSTIMAFHKVFMHENEAKLAVVGNGPLLDVCKQYVTEKKLSQAVTFHGVLDRSEIMKLFSNSCCFVQHSVVAKNGDEEGTPVAVMEAMLAGLVVVSTRHAGIPDVIQEGLGYLVDENDIDGMAEAMVTVLQNIDHSQAMADRAKQYVLAHHTAELHLGQINAFLS